MHCGIRRLTEDKDRGYIEVNQDMQINTDSLVIIVYLDDVREKRGLEALVESFFAKPKTRNNLGI